MESDDKGEERAARRASHAHIESTVLELHTATETELIIREEDWVDHD